LEINPNAHYIFSDDGAGRKFYALAGLDIYLYGFNFGDGGLLGGLGNYSATDVGPNVGAGANISRGNMAGYAEAKF
jgi:hypothetical protein